MIVPNIYEVFQFFRRYVFLNIDFSDDFYKIAEKNS